MPGKEPDHIQVQHVLIGFSGSVPGKRITRSQEEARTLAYDLLALRLNPFLSALSRSFGLGGAR